ncbi:MAG TPA: FG-GAP-like repeat-containing protein [Bryobacteraceae bacterium]|nr:FG-GAP-like repeat-containing protein [Bryobacteraceae bacterium]
MAGSVNFNRRQFLAASSFAALAGRLSAAARMPYETLREFLEPGKDAFPQEKIAMDVARRLRASRPGRYYPLPGNQVRFEIPGKTKDGALEYRTGYYKMNWPAGDTTISGVTEERVVTAKDPLFRDITANVFGGVNSFDEQLARGIPFWRARLDPASGIDVYGITGIAVGDIDNDGVDEIYVCQPGGLPNRLYKFRDGRMHDITEEAGVGFLDDTPSALFIDLRNLGRQDLVLMFPNGPVLMLNDGRGRYEARTDAFKFARPAQGTFTGMAAADYDRDGAVDLYLCTYIYFQSEAQYRYPSPYHDAQNGPPNYLFRNRLQPDGSGIFEDVTEASGIDQNNNRFSFAAAWCDYDQSGWPSLYVANDFGRKNLYQNRGGRFRDVAAEAGVEDLGPGMSASWFDYDGDGKFDLYVSNMWSDIGQRVSSSKPFRPAQYSAAMAEAYHRHTKGNSLYRNLGGGHFEEAGAREAVEMGRWAWGSGGHDFDNDGWPEIFVTCGMLANKGPEDAMGFFWREVVANAPVDTRPAEAYENGWNAINQYIREDCSWSAPEPNVFYIRQDGRFVDHSAVSGLDFAEDSRAYAVTDLDGDGNLDLLVKNRLGPQVRVFQNQCAGHRNSIAFSLRGTKSNRDAIGAVVEVDGHVQFVAAGSGFLSQHSKRLHFGMGDATVAKRVRIRWPSGPEQVFESLAVGQLYSIEEGSDHVSSKPFAVRPSFPQVAAVPVDNEPRLHTTWFLEPVPLPRPGKAPGLLVVKPNDADSAIWAIFRRYLFDYRTGFTEPILLLVDAENRARKIYAQPPSAAQLEMDRSANAAAKLPFPGDYLASTPRRDYFKLGAAFFAAGYPDCALPYLEEVMRRSPSERALSAIAQIHLGAGRIEDARATAKRLLATPPQSSATADSLGLQFAEKALYPEARDLFERAISIQRDNTSAINNLGVLYIKMGQVADAVAAFRYGIRVAPDDDMLYLNLGRVYIQSGDREKARALMSEWLDRNPNNQAAQRAMRELDSR